MSFRTALSGLTAAQTDLNVTGNNIANASTAGFKGSRTEFADVYAASYLGVGSTTAGSGVRVSAITQDFSQGNIEFTSNNFDVAINGEGFFILSDSGSDVFTRAGSFHLDREGNVVNNQDLRLQVYPAAGADTFDTGILQDLQLQTAEGPPNATTEMSIGVNLNASDDEPVAAFDPTDPDTYNNSSSLLIYDSLGSSHTATMYFRKDETTPPGVNLWNSYVYVDGSVVTSGGTSPVSVSFNSDGTLATAMPITYDAVATTTGSLPINMTLNLNGTTQYGSPFSVNTLAQDGFATGRLTGVGIDSNGVVSARYTNGQATTLGKIALATFANMQGLNPLGDTSWASAFSSGDRVLGEAGRGTFGVLQSSALEASNVDIAQQLVQLITAQRNYQANAQAISTEDQITQTIINIR